VHVIVAGLAEKTIWEFKVARPSHPAGQFLTAFQRPRRSEVEKQHRWPKAGFTGADLRPRLTPAELQPEWRWWNFLAHPPTGALA